MSSNPPDPNEYLKFFLIQQQQQAQMQQTQGGAAAMHQPNQQGTVPSAGSGALGDLIAGYLRASKTSASGNGAAANGSSPFASLPPSTNAPAPNIVASVQQQQQQLLASAKLLSSVSPSLAAAAVEHAMALVQPASQQQQQGIPLHFHQHGAQHQFSLNPQGGHPLSSLSTDATKKSPSSSINTSGNGTSNPSHPSIALQGTSGSFRDSTNSNSNGGNKKKGSVTILLPPEPVSLLVLQTWNLEQLEAHAKILKEYNQPIPNAVKVLLDHARRREEQRHAKRNANRKSEATSRARQKQLIDELTAANAQLRRQALILSCMPDPVVAISVDGKINFAGIQVERILRHKVSDLVGANLEDILVPESRGAIRRLIQDLLVAEQQEAEAINREGAGESGDSSNDANVVSRSSDQSFPMLEVNVDGQNEVASGENVSDSSASKNEGKKSSKHNMILAKSNSRLTVSSLSRKSSSLATETSTDDNDEPPTMKNKTVATEKNAIATAEERKNKSPVSRSLDEPKASGTVDMNVDDVMGASVTAGAKLLSLMHYSKEELKEEVDDRKPPPEELKQEPHIHRKHGLAPQNASQKEGSQSSSSTGSAPEARTGVNSSEDSGYRDSNESSDEYPEDLSILSGGSVVLWKKGKRPHLLAPCCHVRLIRNDLSTVWCELTSSVHTRRFNDEDSEFGIIDHNPKPAADVLAEELTAEKELLLCFRPLFEGGKVGEEFRFPRQVSKSSNANESEELTLNKSTSGNDEEGVDPSADAPSNETQADCAESMVEGQHPLKKRSFEEVSSV